jgi:aminopeptidase N
VPLPWLPDPKLRLLVPSGALDCWRDQPLFTFVPQRTDPRRADRGGYLADPDTDPVETAGWKYADRTSYGTNSYPRTGVVLRTLQGLVGDEAFYRGMRHYAKEWRYAHPYPADFYRSFQEGAGAGAAPDWFFPELFQGTGTVDWSVSVEQARRAKPRGYFQGEAGEFLERAKPEPKDDEDEEEPKTPYRIEVELRKKGTLALPLPVRLTFEDQSTQDLVWSREEQQAQSWKRIELEREKKLVSAVIDPERRYYIDRDLSNDRWFDATDELTPWRWTERVLAQFQHYLHFIQGLGG